MKGSLAIIAILFLALPVQAASTGWIKGYSGSGWDSGRYVVPLNEGFLIIGLTTTPTTGRWGVLLLRVNGRGNIIWAKTWEPAGNVYDLSGVAIDRRGRIYVAGTVENGKFGKDGFVLAFSPGGELIWQKIVGTPKDDFLSSLTLTNGAIYVAGTSKGAEFRTGTVSSAFLAKLDENGNAEWIKTYENGYYTAFVGLVQMKNDLYALGKASIPGETDVLRAPLWLVHLSRDRRIILQKRYVIGGKRGAYSIDEFVKVDRDLLALVEFSSHRILLCIDENGTVKWAKDYRAKMISVSTSEKGLAAAVDNGLLLMTTDGKPVGGVKFSFYPYTGGEQISRAIWRGTEVVATGYYQFENAARESKEDVIVLRIPANLTGENMITPIGEVKYRSVDVSELSPPNVSVRNAEGTIKILDAGGKTTVWNGEEVWFYPWARLEIILPSFGAVLNLKSAHYAVGFSLDHSTNLTVLPDLYNVSAEPSIPGSFKLQRFNTSVRVEPGDKLVLYLDFENGKTYLKRIGSQGKNLTSKTSSSTSQNGKSTTTTEHRRNKESKEARKNRGICGPTVLVALAVLTVLRRR